MGDLVHSRARERIERPRGGLVATEPGFREAVQAKLELDWSPEQIGAWLRTGRPLRKRRRFNGRHRSPRRPC